MWIVKPQYPCQKCFQCTRFGSRGRSRLPSEAVKPRPICWPRELSATAYLFKFKSDTLHDDTQNFSDLPFFRREKIKKKNRLAIFHCTFHPSTKWPMTLDNFFRLTNLKSFIRCGANFSQFPYQVSIYKMRLNKW